MPDFDPKRDGWTLCEAVRRTADQWALAALHRDLIDAAAAGIQHEPIAWWHWTDPPLPPPAPAHNPPRPVPIIEMEDGRRWLLCYGIETQFLHKLYSGELVCRGRPGSALAEYCKAPPGSIVGIESWWKGGGILRVESGELLYTARVDRVGKTKTNSGGHPGLPYRDTVIGQTIEWLDEEGEQPLPKIRDFMHNLCAGIDEAGGPVRNTLNAWANQALAEFRRMRGIK